MNFRQIYSRVNQVNFWSAIQAAFRLHRYLDICSPILSFFLGDVMGKLEDHIWLRFYFFLLPPCEVICQTNLFDVVGLRIKDKKCNIC